ncbi:MAG: zinc ribbon domain-containing protein [Patescibacteria group bacterium UBA2103]
MECSNCKTHIEPSDNFCTNCGTETPQVYFYGKNWRKQHSIVLVKSNNYDIFISDKSLYIIKFKAVIGAGIGFLFGLIILSILGAFIGGLIGNRFDERKIKRTRSTWITDSNRLISKKYKEFVYIQIPFEEISRSLEIKDKKIHIYTNNKKYTFLKNKEEIALLKKKLKKYVL